jgi:hypothetical protein
MTYLEANKNLPYVKILKDLQVTGNITTAGTFTASNLSILGDYTILNTTTSNTEQIIITNAGTGPALKVTQTGAFPIAEFYDDGQAIALKVADGGNVGIGTALPLQKLHVQGSVMATTQVLGPAIDTVGAPGFSWSGNANTGMYRPGADKLGLVTAGVERVSVLANGNVGVGTTNPSTSLHVVGDIGFNYSGAIRVSPQNAAAWSAGTTKLIESSYAINNLLGDVVSIYTPGQGSALPRISATSTGVIHLNGYVGIGTTNPQLPLQITTSGDSLQWGNNTYPRIGGLGYSADANSGWLGLFSGANYNIAIRANGVSHLSGGNVGIGTNSPTASLDVFGDLRVRSTVNHTGGLVSNSGYISNLSTSGIVIHNFRGMHAVMSASGSGNTHVFAFVYWIGNLNSPVMVTISSNGINASINSGTAEIALQAVSVARTVVWNITYFHTPTYSGGNNSYT